MYQKINVSEKLFHLGRCREPFNFGFEEILGRRVSGVRGGSLPSGRPLQCRIDPHGAAGVSRHPPRHPDGRGQKVEAPQGRREAEDDRTFGGGQGSSEVSSHHHNQL